MTEETAVKDIFASMIAHRRWFHKHPETGFELYKTHEYIVSKLKKIGKFKIETLAGTGIKATFYKGIDKKTIAFRSDMDAISIKEESGLAFSSDTNGVMHACGHDGHMAILLGLAEWISFNEVKIKFNVVLIFQPAEESDGGAEPMIDEGVLKNPNVDAIFGLHLFPSITLGLVALKSGALMALTSEFDINIKGKSSHGAMPHKGSDALMAAACFVSSIDASIRRRIDPMSNVLVTVGKLLSGERRNVIAEKASIEGIIRTFHESDLALIKSIITNILGGLNNTFDVDTEFKETAFYPAVINDDSLVNKLKLILPSDSIIEATPVLTAEDFSFYQKAVPGVFILLGTGKEFDYNEPLHSNKFDFDEAVLEKGLDTFVRILNGISDF